MESNPGMRPLVQFQPTLEKKLGMEVERQSREKILIILEVGMKTFWHVREGRESC